MKRILKTTLSFVSIMAARISTQHIVKQSAATSESLEAAKRDCFWGLFVGDALAMPVHWYYNPSDIKRGYGGWISQYTAPSNKHPSSIMSLSAVDGSGRTGWHHKSQQIVGQVILHDKLKYWTKEGRNVHYHQGMSAGDNTLNAITALQTMKTLQTVDPEGTLPLQDAMEAVMENYVRFMTTPGTHNDTYAESFHRLFFRDWAATSCPPRSGAEVVEFCTERYQKVTHNTEDNQIPVIGALVLTIPWIIHYAHLPVDECVNRVIRAIYLTHPAPSLQPYVDIYSRLLYAVLHGANVLDEAHKALDSPAFGQQRKMVEGLWKEFSLASSETEQLEIAQHATSMLGSACYIQGAMTSMLFLAGAFHDDFDKGVLTNTNCGGENVHRGAVLAAILAAGVHHQRTPVSKKWKTGLHSLKPTIQQIVDSKL